MSQSDLVNLSIAADTGATMGGIITLVCPEGDGPLPCQAIVDLIAALCPDHDIRVTSRPEDAPDTGAVVLVQQPPATALAFRLASGARPKEVLETCLSDWRDRLALQRLARRRITLVDPGLLAFPDPDAMFVLAHRLGVPYREVSIARSKAFQPASHILALIAGRLLEEPGCSEVVDELGAATLGFSGTGHADGANARDPWREWSELVAQRDEAGRLRLRIQEDSAALERGALEADGLRMQVAAISAELQQSRVDLETRLDQTLTDLAQCEGALSATVAELAHVRIEEGLLRENLGLQMVAHGQNTAEIQRLVEQAALSKRERDAQNATEQVELSRLRAQLATLSDKEAQFRTAIEPHEMPQEEAPDSLPRLRAENDLLRENLALNLKFQERGHGEATRLREEISNLQQQLAMQKEREKVIARRVDVQSNLRETVTFPVADAGAMRQEIMAGGLQQSLVAGTQTSGPKLEAALTAAPSIGALLSSAPKDTAFLYLGANPAMCAALLDELAEHGFRKRMLVPESLVAYAPAGEPRLQACPGEAACQRAGAIIIDADASPEMRLIIADLAAAVVKVENGRARLGETARPLVFHGEGGASLMKVWSQLQEKDVRGLTRSACFSGTSLTPVVSREIASILRRLLEVDAVSGADLFDMAMYAGELRRALREEAVIDALHPFEDHVAMRLTHLLEPTFAPNGAVALAVAEPESHVFLTALARASDWRAPDWAACARQVTSRRSSWAWERAQVMYVLGRIRAQLPNENTLIVVEHDEPLVDRLVRELGAVDVIHVEELLEVSGRGVGGLPTGARSVSGLDLSGVSYGLVIFPHASLFRRGLGGVAGYVSGLRQHIPAGGYVLVCGETAAIGPGNAIRPGLENGGPAGFPAALSNLLGLEAQDVAPWAWRREDFALVSSVDNAGEDSLGFRHGADVFLPTFWTFRASGREFASRSHVEAAFSDMLLGEQSARMTLADGARRDDQGIHTTIRKTHFVYGPYLRLAEGSYRARFVVQASSPEGSAVVEIGLGDTIVAQKTCAFDVDAKGGPVELTLDFVVPAGSPPCEARVWNEDLMELSLLSLKLERAPLQPVRAPRGGLIRRLAARRRRTRA